MSEKLSEMLKVTMYDFDPGATGPTDVKWLPMKDYDQILCTVMATVLTGNGVVAMSILGNTQAAGGGTDVTVAPWTLVDAPDAAFDMVTIEATQADFASAAADAGVEILGVSLAIELANAADEGVVTYVMRAKTLKASNTADVVAS